LIIGVVRERDHGNFSFLRDAHKKFMTQFSGGHFDGEFRFFGETTHVRACNHKRQFQRRSSLANEFFISIAAPAA